jgi:uncharacterized protein (DUF58 family)
MIPSLRLLLLLLLAAPLVAGAAFGPLFVAMAVIYLLLVAGLLISDLLLTPRPDSLELERINDTRLSIGAANLITLLLANRSSRPLRFTLRDEYPDEIVADTRFLSGTLEPYGVFEGRYHLTPNRRGDYRFGNTVVRYQSLLGMFVRQARYPTAAAVKVYPNVLEVRKYDLMARKGLLYELGLRQARIFGQGSEFERLREYNPDDEFRRINWKATARRGKPIAAEFETERSQYVVCAIDSGRLMRPPVDNPQNSEAPNLARLDYVINTALLLTYVATLKGDHVGMLSFADEVGAYLAPKRGKGQFYRVLETLYNVQSEAVEADYTRALSYLSLKNRRRSLIVVFTDLVTLDSAKPLIASMARLAQRHLPLVVTISDPNVAREVGIVASDSAMLYRRAVAEMLTDERQVILDTLNRSGVLTVDVPADKLTVSVINTYLELKARGKL